MKITRFKVLKKKDFHMDKLGNELLISLPFARELPGCYFTKIITISLYQKTILPMKKLENK